MRKEEFLEELRNGLEGMLPQQDIGEITSDYNDVFENAIAEGKDEEETAAELGSPARIARTILEEDELKRKETAAREAEDRARMAEEEARRARAAEAAAREAEARARAAASREREMAAEPKYMPYVSRLAPMGTRLAAFLVDGLIQALLFLLLSLILIGGPSMISSFAGHGSYGYWDDYAVVPFFAFFLVFCLMVSFNVLSMIFIWATNGYTPGKWLFKIRVIKLGGGKLTFMDALLREFLIKSIANSITSGLVDIISFIWGCVSDVNKTIHDAVADTTVIYDERRE